MSTTEEALKKAMEQKAEEVRVRGDALQQMVENAVRNALGGTLKAEKEGTSNGPFHSAEEQHPERMAQGKPVLSIETGHSLESYRGFNAIAVNIKLKTGEGKKGAILFSSAVPKEGTTTVCVNVARTLAKVYTGNVLLLDCNAIHPDIHRLLKTDASPGLIDILMKKIDLDGAIKRTNVKNFYVLTFGPAIQEPLSLLGSEQMEGLLTTLKSEFDYIFIDAPPILVSAVAELIAPWVDGSVLVIKANTTRREVVIKAVEKLIQQKDFIGAIYNQQEFKIPQFLYKRLK